MSLSDYLKPSEEIDATLEENEVKFQALEEMKAIQTTLGSISFISVIAVMREDNPLKEDIHEFEQMLHELTVGVSTFINDNLADAVDDTEDDSKNRVDTAVKGNKEEEEIDKKSPKPKE